MRCLLYCAPLALALACKKTMPSETEGTPIDTGEGDPVDAALAKLPVAVFDVCTPKTVPLGQSFEVALALDVTGDQDTVRDLLEKEESCQHGITGVTNTEQGQPRKPSEREERDMPTARVDDSVKVGLVAPHATVEMVKGEPRMLVTPTRPRVWTWHVAPDDVEAWKAEETIVLTFNVSTYLRGIAPSAETKSATREVAVEVSNTEKAKSWLQSHEWAWTLLGAPIGTFAWGWWRRRRDTTPRGGDGV